MYRRVEGRDPPAFKGPDRFSGALVEQVEHSEFSTYSRDGLDPHEPVSEFVSKLGKRSQFRLRVSQVVAVGVDDGCSERVVVQPRDDQKIDLQRLPAI